MWFCIVRCSKGHVVNLPTPNADGSFKTIVCWSCVAGL